MFDGITAHVSIIYYKGAAISNQSTKYSNIQLINNDQYHT